MSVNKVILLGRLGQDPEMRFTPNGQGVCSFSLATSENWSDKSGERKERTEWHRIVVWGKQAELCNKYLAKGRQVYIEGKLQTRSWEDKTGQKKYTTEIQANAIKFIGGNNTASTNDSMPSDEANILDQDYNITSDSNFASDDIPF